MSKDRADLSAFGKEPRSISSELMSNQLRSLKQVLRMPHKQSCHTTRRHEGWSTTNLRKSRQERSKYKGWARTTDIWVSNLTL
ncbi:hypothetical protein T265_03533 [Opisthorchis viverrini]|uniref:Uncharacterized protein n=1 Tax=Opisthorchis viverrini TaxID=6198 RepID=A0A074ZS34_OPIVI|nr:hypothetical protein T265_03533 [Opisthorchis viverrini]KER29946.1 hypothetical protein T265_03533 [Opisthorchis viverrini]